MHVEHEFSVPHEDNQETSELIQEELREYLADAKVGAIKFAAFSDYVEYEHLSRTHSNTLRGIGEAREQVRKQGFSPTTEDWLLFQESLARETEVVMGMLRLYIALEQSRTPGYYAANERTYNFRERLEEAYKQEGEKDYAGKAIAALLDARGTVLEQGEKGATNP